MADLWSHLEGSPINILERRFLYLLVRRRVIKVTMEVELFFFSPFFYSGKCIFDRIFWLTVSILTIYLFNLTSDLKSDPAPSASSSSAQSCPVLSCQCGSTAHPSTRTTICPATCRCGLLHCERLCCSAFLRSDPLRRSPSLCSFSIVVSICEFPWSQ